MGIRDLRIARGWSQEQLAELSGVSARTIQRLEGGQNAGLESLNALAAAFDVEVGDLKIQLAPTMGIETTDEAEKALEDAREMKDFFIHLIGYLLIIPLFFAINLMTNPSNLWALWAALGGGIALVIHGLSLLDNHILGFFWEKKQVEKRLGKRL